MVMVTFSENYLLTEIITNFEFSQNIKLLVRIISLIEVFFSQNTHEYMFYIYLLIIY